MLIHHFCMCIITLLFSNNSFLISNYFLIILLSGWIVGVLAVCWLPFQARRLMTILRSKDQWTETYYRSYITLQPITNCFYYVSACLTPLLYNLTSRNFRRCFLHSISPCMRRLPLESGSWEAQSRYQGIRLSVLQQETCDR